MGKRWLWMTNHLNDQAGFSTSMVAVALVVVLVIAGVGFAVINRSDKDGCNADRQYNAEG